MGLCSVVSTGPSRRGKRKRGRGDGKGEEEMKIENAAFSELKGAQGAGEQEKELAKSSWKMKLERSSSSKS